MDQAEYHQMMLERQQRLEEAILTAVNGSGTDDDWAVICAECGIPPVYILKGKRHGNHSEKHI
jgi:hypothetical protein